MALVLADRVKETSTTTGTGTYTLAGAVTGFESFASIGNGNTTYYACTLGSDFEVGIGTYTASGTTLARTTILQSSNSDNAVDWGAGTKTLFCTQPAEKAVFRDASGHIIALDGRNLTNVDAATLDSIDSGSFLRSDVADTKTSGFLTFNDNIELQFGTGADFDILFNGTNAVLRGNAGNISLQPHSSGNLNIWNGSAFLLKADVTQNDVELYAGGTKRFETTSTGATVTGQLVATSLDISGDVDVDGTLEADAMTLNGTAITSTATLSTGISNNNVPKFTSGVADNDFLRVDGTSIEGRSASEVLSDIGGISASSTDTLTNKTLTTPVINGFSGTGDGSLTGDLTLTSTDAGSGADPILELYRNSASPTDGDVLGEIHFFGNDEGGTKTKYAEIKSIAGSEDNGNERGQLQFNLVQNGNQDTQFMSMGFNLVQFFKNIILRPNINIQFEGSTDDGNETTLTVTDPTGDRTITLPDATGTVSLLTNTETLTNKTLTSPVINGFSGTGDGSITGDLTLTSTDAGASENPTLDLYRNSASPADSDVLGHINFSGEDSAGNKTVYAKINADAIDVTDGTEDGRLDFKVISNGSESQRITLAGSQTIFQNADVKISDADLILESTDAGASENPTLDLYRNSASPADSDVLGHINFSGENSAGEKIVYAKINSDIQDQTDGTEDGRLDIGVISQGSFSPRIACQGNGTTDFMNRDVRFSTSVDLKFEGETGNANETTLTVTDPTADRTITLPDATGTVLLADGDGSSLTNVNATTLDSVDSTSFLRSDADDNKTNGNLTFEDNIKARFGTVGDLQIFHNGSNSIIAELGTGELQLQTNGTSIKLVKANTSEILANFIPDGSVDLYHDASKKFETTSGGISVTGEVAATSLDISGDVDVDGTLEADAMTLNGTAITATATLSTGISNNNVPKFTSGVADNDFLRVDGTSIEGRSASEVLSDIGAQASLTFGISNTNAVKIDSTSVADNEFARFTANGLESRSTSEVLSDIGAITASSTDTLTNKTINASQLSGTVADARLSSAVLTTSNSDAPATTTSSSDADFVLVDDGGTMKKITPSNLGITSGGTTAAFATAMAMVL